MSEVPKCSKIPIFRGSAPNPAGGGEGAYSAFPDFLTDGLAAPAKNPTSALGPSGLVSTGFRV